MCADDYVISLLKKEPCKDISLDAFKFSESYYEYLRRSMVSLKFDDSSIKDFCVGWRDYRNCLKKFMDSRDVMEAIKLKGRLQRLCADLEFYEQQVKISFTRDWNTHLTRLQEGEYSEFAIIVQALGNDDFRNPGRGKVIAGTLFTKQLQALYQNRYFGFVYDLMDRDILLVSSSDANTDFSELDESKAGLKHHSNVIGEVLGRASLQGEAFFSFEEFKTKCSSDYFNEIIMGRTSWRGQLPSGVFIREGISEENKQLALLTAKLRKIPVCEYDCGTLKIYFQ